MRKLLPGLLLFALALPLFPQSFPFTVRIQQTDLVANVANNSTIGVNAPLNGSDSLDISLVYQGQGSVTISSAPELLGSTAFSLSNVSGVPATLLNSNLFRYTITYTPRSSSSVNAQVNIPFVETITGPNDQTVTNRGIFTLQFTGTAPEFVVSYISPNELNFNPVANGGTIDFSSALLNTTTDFTISVANRGSGPGLLSSLFVTGDAFRPLGLPLLPTNIPSGSELRFGIRFQPRALGPAAGRLSVVSRSSLVSPSTTVDINLAGNAFQRALSYELFLPDRSLPISPSQPVNLGEVTVGETLFAQVVVRNDNPVAIPVPPLAISGVGYSVGELPSATQVEPGDTFRFALQVAINQTGTFRGRLRVGDDFFDLLTTGSGPQLRYSYTSSGSGDVPIPASGTVFFPGTNLGESNRAVFTVRNTGIRETNLISIAIAEVRSAFSLPNLPALPLRLQPNEEISFAIDFRPSAAGPSSAVLRIDAANFLLSGTTIAVPPLPGYRFTLPSGPVAPLDQPAVGLELAAPFPVALTGVLTLNQDSLGFGLDPSVRFANGATTIAFTIPANSTRAIFPSSADSIRFQTGSVASEISLRATFNLPGDIPAEDPNPTFLRLTVPPSAPRILTLTANTGNVLQLVLTGLVTSRSLTRMEVELTPVEGFQLNNNRLSFNLEGESLLWFSSPNSQNFGGLFTLSLPISLTDGNTGGNAVNSIASIRVTLSNATGQSAPAELVLR